MVYIFIPFSTFLAFRVKHPRLLSPNTLVHAIAQPCLSSLSTALGLERKQTCSTLLTTWSETLLRGRTESTCFDVPLQPTEPSPASIKENAAKRKDGK